MGLGMDDMPVLAGCCIPVWHRAIPTIWTMRCAVELDRDYGMKKLQHTTPFNGSKKLNAEDRSRDINLWNEGPVHVREIHGMGVALGICAHQLLTYVEVAGVSTHHPYLNQQKFGKCGPHFSLHMKQNTCLFGIQRYKLGWGLWMRTMCDEESEYMSTFCFTLFTFTFTFTFTVCIFQFRSCVHTRLANWFTECFNDSSTSCKMGKINNTK